jgi:hypothetical protein
MWLLVYCFCQAVAHSSCFVSRLPHREILFRHVHPFKSVFGLAELVSQGVSSLRDVFSRISLYRIDMLMGGRFPPFTVRIALSLPLHITCALTMTHVYAFAG